MDSEKLTQQEYNNIVYVIDSWCEQHDGVIMPHNIICKLIGIDDRHTRRFVDKKRYLRAKLKYGF